MSTTRYRTLKGTTNGHNLLWDLLRWSRALTFGYGCIVYVEFDIEARDAELDVIFI